MNTAQQILNGLDWSYLTDILVAVIPSLICITLHELSHGFCAYLLGDNTAKNAGRLTLNPLRHIDWWGLVMMALFHFGWAKPVPVNMNNFKNPKRGMAITALAGPVSNLIIAVVFLFLYGLVYAPLYTGGTFAQLLLQTIGTTAYLSVALAVFNFIPLPPLDGSKVVFSLLSDDGYTKLMHYERYGMIIVMVLVVTGALTGVLSTATGWVYDRLFVIAELAFRLTGH